MYISSSKKAASFVRITQSNLSISLPAPEPTKEVAGPTTQTFLFLISDTISLLE